MGIVLPKTHFEIIKIKHPAGSRSPIFYATKFYPAFRKERFLQRVRLNHRLMHDMFDMTIPLHDLFCLRFSLD
jgi:hypothetical protein